MNIRNKYIIPAFLILLVGCEDSMLDQDPVTSSAENDMFRIEISAATDVTDLSGTIPFEVTITRLQDFTVRHDSRLVGSWELSSMTVDGQNANISQFPTTYDFYTDFSFTKTVTNTITISLSQKSW